MLSASCSVLLGFSDWSEAIFYLKLHLGHTIFDKHTSFTNNVSGVLNENPERVLAAPTTFLLQWTFSTSSTYCPTAASTGGCAAVTIAFGSQELSVGTSRRERANHEWYSSHLMDEGLRITETFNLYRNACGSKIKDCASSTQFKFCPNQSPVFLHVPF